MWFTGGWPALFLVENCIWIRTKTIANVDCFGLNSNKYCLWVFWVTQRTLLCSKFNYHSKDVRLEGYYAIFTFQNLLGWLHGRFACFHGNAIFFTATSNDVKIRRKQNRVKTILWSKTTEQKYTLKWDNHFSFHLSHFIQIVRLLKPCDLIT